MTQLLALTAVVEAEPGVVAAVVLDVRPGGRSPFASNGELVEGEPMEGERDEFVVVRDGSRLTVTVDRSGHTVSEQGEWWYRGVIEVLPDPRGARIVRRILNLDERKAWAVRFVSRGPLNAAPAAFAEAVRRLGEELGVPARVED